MSLQEYLLYLLDIAFRLAQQVQPVVVSNVSACKSATLATLHFNADPPHPHQAYSGMVLTAIAVLLQWSRERIPALQMSLVAWSVLGVQDARNLQMHLSMICNCQQGVLMYV